MAEKEKSPDAASADRAREGEDMKRDMELCRKILFAIEEEYEDVAIYNLSIDGYTMKQVA